MKTPSTFTVQGLPTGLFGQAYVIVSTWLESASLWKAEYHILTTRPHEWLHSGVVGFETSDYPAELEAIDAGYMEAEAIRQAEIDLILELEKRANVSGHPDLAYLPVELRRAQITPVTLWVRDVFPNKFVDMTNAAASQELRNYLRLVMGLQKLRTA